MFRLLLVPVLFFGLRANFSEFFAPSPGSELGIATLFETLTFILSTLVVACLIDHSLVVKMFVSKNGELDAMNIINWICSLTFLANLPYVIGYSRQSDILWREAAQPMSPSGITLILAFTTISFLTGSFYRTYSNQQSDDATTVRDAAARKVEVVDWRKLVPPAYYAGCTAYVLQAQCLVAITLGSVLFATNFVAAFVGRRRGSSSSDTAAQQQQEAEEPTVKAATASKQQKADTDAKCGANASLYSMVEVPASSEQFHWGRQLVFDLLAYIMPLIILGCIFPVLQIPLSALCVATTVLPYCYQAISKFVYLQPSEFENLEKAKERLGTYLPGAEYPNGWFRLLNSAELAVKQVKYVRAVGRDLAVFRGEDKQVRCVDAYCVHLGANLAMGGRVVNNCLECPFHRWQFAGDGKCAHIPYTTGAIPKQARTRAYHVYEFFGMILVWLAQEQQEQEQEQQQPQQQQPLQQQEVQQQQSSTEAEVHDSGSCSTTSSAAAVAASAATASVTAPPPYFPPEPLCLSAGGRVFRGETRRIVNMHIQEFAENSTDFAHFQPLHGTMTLPYTTIEIPAISINHRPGWNEGVGKESHICWFLDSADINLFGKQVPNSGAMAKITFVGPASVVYFTFETPIGSIVLFQTHTPLEPLRLDVNFRWYADAHMPRNLVWYIVGNWIAQWQNDIMVWENKKFLRNPLLVRGDGPMNKSRRWYKQFYTPSAQKPILAYASTSDGANNDGKSSASDTLATAASCGATAAAAW